MNLELIRRQLHDAGLNLFARIDLSDVADPGLDAWDALLLIGNVGPAMWRAMPAEFFDLEDPVDDYVRYAVSEVVGKAAGRQQWQLLYPVDNTTGPSLLSLGRVAGWHLSLIHI